MSTQHGSIKVTNKKAFTLSCPKLLNAEGKTISLPEPPNQNITFAIRQSARFYSFNVLLMPWLHSLETPVSVQKLAMFLWKEKLPLISHLLKNNIPGKTMLP